MPSLTQLVEGELGPVFIGFAMSLWLYGTTVSQTIFYFRSFPNDSKATKYLVCFLCIVDTFHIYLLGHLVWNFLVVGRFTGLGVLLVTIPWQLLASFITTFFVISVVQCFFAFRVWNVSGKNWIITSIIGLSSTAQFGSGMEFSNHLIKAKSLALAFDHDRTSSGRIQLSCSIVCDLAISASLTFYFFTLRAGVERTRHLLQHLIILSVNTGVLLCLVMVVTIVLFQVKSGSLVSLGPQFILSKLYVNSLLATLNSRTHFRALVRETIDFSLPTLSATTSTPLSQQNSNA